MIPHTSSLPTPATTRRIVIEQVPSGVIGEWSMTIRYEGCPEGWPLVHAMMADALKQVAGQMVLADRERRAAQPPQILLPGERV